MGQDLRTLMKKGGEERKVELPENHRREFEALLDEKFPKPASGGGGYQFWRMAAVLAVIVALGALLYHPFNSGQEQQAAGEQAAVKATTITLGDLSPELGKVEDYYLTSINYELAALETDPANQALLKEYMQQLSVLNKEYENLTLELNTIGPNDKTVSALISNLEMRLRLLYKLKQKLNELKNENDETQSLQTV